MSFLVLVYYLNVVHFSDLGTLNALVVSSEDGMFHPYSSLISVDLDKADFSVLYEKAYVVILGLSFLFYYLLK